jgi:siroheme synthase
VVLMGVGSLATIPARLVAAGRAPSTPAAVISRGTTPAQQVVTGTLADIAERARHLSPPATIVIGEVVHLAEDDSVRVEAASRWTAYAGDV